MTSIELPDPAFEWNTYARRTETGSRVFVTKLLMGDEILFERETPASTWEDESDPIIDDPDDAEHVVKAEFADKFRRLFS